ncbi:MAG TPA: hypothetical protein VF070_00595 [Streptosporangiaceae bacterium]
MSLFDELRVPETWLTAGYRDGTAVLSGTRVLATGLEPGDEEVLVAEGLARDVGGGVLVCEGPEIRPSGGRTVIHYDMTGQCRDGHAHVVFDPVVPFPMTTFAAQQLVTAVIDPDGTWRPPASADASDLAAFIQPEMWTVVPVLSATLWAASAAGYGVREAMDWLASDQLGQIAAYCRSLAGPNPLPLLESVQALVNGPAPARQQAVYLAWQALAPAEANIRNTPGSQRLDLDGWLSAQAVLAISLPPGAEVADEQIVAALLAAAHEFLRQRNAGDLGSVWRDTQPPRKWNAHWGVFTRRALIIASQPARFRDWAGAGIAHDLLLGQQAHAESLAVARCPQAAQPGQVILVKRGVTELLSAPAQMRGGTFGPGRGTDSGASTTDRS